MHLNGLSVANSLDANYHHLLRERKVFIAMRYEPTAFADIFHAPRLATKRPEAGARSS